MIEVRELKVKSLEVKQVAKSYHFRFEETFGWAIFTVNDSTGELNIQSDWGDWAHRWGGAGLGGKTISQAIASWTDAHYLCDKLHYGKDRDQFDGVETRKGLRERILEKRREMDISKEAARELWDETEHHIDFDTPDTFMNSISREMDQFLDGMAYEYIRRSPTYGWEILLRQLLPLFIDTLRKEQGLEPKRAATAHVVAG
jgi:hypothetical protein